MVPFHNSHQQQKVQTLLQRPNFQIENNKKSDRTIQNVYTNFLTRIKASLPDCHFVLNTMEPDKHLPEADRGTDVANQGDENPAIPTEAPPQESEPPKQELRGFAASYAAYLKDQSENPDRDILAEDIRQIEERQAAKIKQRESKETYFFYGTLMDPGIAQKILGLEAPPSMRPAVLRNRGHLKMLGPFPAFVADEDPRVEVKGIACEIEGAARKDRLAAYEGEKYVERLCLIRFLSEDGSTAPDGSVFSVVFAWVGGDDELDDGTFDLEAYKAAKAELEAAEK